MSKWVMPMGVMSLEMMSWGRSVYRRVDQAKLAFSAYLHLVAYISITIYDKQKL